MKLIQYLEMKYPNGSKGFTRAEAKIIGMPYPLEKGWILKFGEVEVDARQLLEAAQSRRERVSARARKKAAAHRLSWA